MMLGGLRHKLNSMVNAKRTVYIGSLMVILFIIKLVSIPMIKARLPSHVSMEHIPMDVCQFGLYNAPAFSQRWMMYIFSDMVEEIMKVFMDEFSVYGKNLMTP